MKMKIAEITFIILLSLFITAVAVQFILAGMAIFVDPAQWKNHTMFIHLFGFNLPIIMLLVAWFAKLPLNVFAQLLGLMTWVFFMYFTANMAGNIPWLAAFHPLVGTGLLISAGILLVNQIKAKKKEKIA